MHFYLRCISRRKSCVTCYPHHLNCGLLRRTISLHTLTSNSFTSWNAVYPTHSPNLNHFRPDFDLHLPATTVQMCASGFLIVLSSVRNCDRPSAVYQCAPREPCLPFSSTSHHCNPDQVLVSRSHLASCTCSLVFSVDNPMGIDMQLFGENICGMPESGSRLPQSMILTHVAACNSRARRTCLGHLSEMRGSSTW